MVSSPTTGDNNMKTFLDKELLDKARAAAHGLMESGEVRTVIKGLDQDASAEFHIMRDLQPGYMPLGRVEVDSVVFYICGETGTVPKDTV